MTCVSIVLIYKAVSSCFIQLFLSSLHGTSELSHLGFSKDSSKPKHLGVCCQSNSSICLPSLSYLLAWANSCSLSCHVHIPLKIGGTCFGRAKTLIHCGIKHDLHMWRQVLSCSFYVSVTFTIESGMMNRSRHFQISPSCLLLSHRAKKFGHTQGIDTRDINATRALDNTCPPAREIIVFRYLTPSHSPVFICFPCWPNPEV